MRYFKLFFDLDEVIYSLSSYVLKVVNEEFNTDYKEDFNRSYWWADYGISQNYFEELLERKGTFLNGKPIPYAIETLNKLHDEGFEIHILTKPVHNEHCYYEKALFLQQYLPWLDLDLNFHTSGNKGLFARNNRILVDDNPSNLESFSANKGISIAFGDYGWNERWNGFKALNWTQLYCLIHDLEGSNYREKDKTFGVDIDQFRNYMKRNDD